MLYLLDTHILLWWLSDSNNLSSKAKKLIANPKNTLFVSSTSAWEISIKKALGKLTSPNNLESVLRESNFLTLDITIPHALLAGELPNHHHDPFDRMLVAQSKLENLTLITHDKIFKKYLVKYILV